MSHMARNLHRTTYRVLTAVSKKVVKTQKVIMSFFMATRFMKNSFGILDQFMASANLEFDISCPEFEIPVHCIASTNLVFEIPTRYLTSPSRYLKSPITV
jgi:hypothetical protein